MLQPHVSVLGGGIFILFADLINFSSDFRAEIAAFVAGSTPQGNPAGAPDGAQKPPKVPPFDATGFVQLDETTVGSFVRTTRSKSQQLLRAFVPHGKATPDELVRVGNYTSPDQLRGFLSGMTRHVPTILKGAGEFWRWRDPKDKDSVGFYYVSDATRDALTAYFATHRDDE